jgi:hypothetical protein
LVTTFVTITCLQMDTRVFDPQEGGVDPQLLPLMEMADHRNFCPHNYEVLPCSRAPAGNGDSPEDIEESTASKSGESGTAGEKSGSAGDGQAEPARCMVWTAGVDLTAGDEICTDYRQAALQVLDAVLSHVLWYLELSVKGPSQVLVQNLPQLCSVS